MKYKHSCTCTLEESLGQNILLILITHFGEWRYDETYGCEIWDKEFEMLLESQQWIKAIQDSVTKALKVHEPRLENPVVRVKVEQKEEFGGEKDRRIRKQLSVETSGVIKNTNEKFSHIKMFYYSPISLD